MKQHGRTTCIAHTDVLLLLAVALASAWCCCFRVVVSGVTSSLLFFFAMQAIFGMLVCPTLSLALRLPPSTFLGQYVHSTGAAWLLQGIVGAMLAQTLLFFWYSL